MTVIFVVIKFINVAHSWIAYVVLRSWDVAILIVIIILVIIIIIDDD